MVCINCASPRACPDTVRAERPQYGGARVTRAGLRIGELSSIEVESARENSRHVQTEGEILDVSCTTGLAPWM